MSGYIKKEQLHQDLITVVDNSHTHINKSVLDETQESFTSILKSKLDGIANGANNYVHPTGDGNLHVPANGTTNNGKVLKASSTSGISSWESVDWSEMSGKSAASAEIRQDAAQALIAEVRTSDPVSPAIGRIWFRSDL